MNMRASRPYHLFSYGGSWYVINIEGMLAQAIDPDAADGLAQAAAAHGDPLAPWLAERLAGMELLPAEGEQPKARQSVKKDPMPIVNMSLFLTQSCNLQCIYCYGDGGGYGQGGDMTEQTAFQAVDWLLDQAGNIKKLHIGFFGGEPFLNFPLMKKVAYYARERAQSRGKDIAFHTTTNATLFHEETIDFIKEYKLDVMVSFDGTKELQDAQRPYANGEGSYDTVVHNIRTLLAALPEVPGHSVIVGDTDPKSVKDAMLNIGFREVSVMPASISLFAVGSGVAGAGRDIRQLLTELEEEGEAWLRLIRVRDKEALQQLKARSGLYQGIVALLHNRKKYHACGAGLGLAAVAADGDIYLCHRFVGQEKYKLGSVFAPGLSRDEYLVSPVTENDVCSSCFARYYCAGGCKHDNAGSGGSVTTPSADVCTLRRRELELAAAVVSRLDVADRAFLVADDIIPPKPCPFDF